MNIDSWLLFGGSWGSALSLLYAQKHPDKVDGLILRGIFMNRAHEREWLLSKDGAGKFFSKEWEQMASHVPENKRGTTEDLLEAIEAISNEDKKLKAAYDAGIYGFSVANNALIQIGEYSKELAKVILNELNITSHYFRNKFFMKDNQITNNMKPIQDADFPIWIVQGRLDLSTPKNTADDLSKLLPRAKYTVVEGAGHSNTIPEIQNETIRAAEEFKNSKR